MIATFYLLQIKRKKSVYVNSYYLNLNQTFGYQAFSKIMLPHNKYFIVQNVPGNIQFIYT